MRFERLDLNLLVALDALIEDRSVSLAARRLFLSQPALSGALNRLREYFRDDLLVQSGRQMVLTPKAEELRGPVREALMLIRARITTPLLFDPATAQRQFTIVASDFAYDVLLAPTFARAARTAPGITFELLATDRLAMERLERGEADVVITIGSYLSTVHPRRRMFEDEPAIICWSGSKHAAGLTEESFLTAGHAIAFFGDDRHPAFTETHFTQQGIARKIEIRLPNFSALPQAVIGTERIATIWRRHAEFFATFLPITVHRPPWALPRIVEEAQWHSLRTNDEGIKWLVELLATQAEQLSPLPLER